jgi:N-methylhydantoinase B
MSNLTFGGRDPSGEPFTYYETIAGGAGGGPRDPGEHGVHTHMTNTRNTPIEAFERQFPARVVRATLERGSGGAGRHSGGDGVTKRLRFLVPVQVAWMAERQRHGPWGLCGGAAGRPGGARVHPAAGASFDVRGAATLDLAAGDELEVRTPGGGGYGASGE